MPLPRPAAIALALALVALPAAAKDPLVMSDATKEKVKRATAIVSNKGGHGTGFLVLPNVLATNAHVIGTRPVNELEAKFVDDNGKVKTYPLQLLAIDGARDLALLRVKDDKFSRDPLELHTDLKAGDNTALGVLGNPGQWGNGWTVINSLTDATLSKELMAKDGLPFYELAIRDAVEFDKPDARPQDADGVEVRARAPGDKIKAGPGNSGGPVLDPNGRAVGVLSRGETIDGTPTGRCYAVPASDLKRMIDGLGKPDGWDTLSRQAAVRHAQNVALLYLWAEVEATAVALDTRKVMWDIANGNSLGYRLLRKPQVIDAECMKAYTATCDALGKPRKDVTYVAHRAALGDESKGLKEELNTLRRITDRHGNMFSPIRKSVTTRDVGKKEFAAYTEELEKYRKLVRDEALKAGWDELFVLQLTRQELSKAKMPEMPTR